MWGIVVPTGKGGSVEVRKYACSTYLGRDTHLCSFNSVAEDIVLPLVLDAVRAALSDPDTIAGLEQAVRRRRQRQEGNAADRTNTLRKQADELAVKVKGLIDKLSRLPADIVDDVACEIRAAKEQRENVLAELRDLERVQAGEQAQEEEIERALSAFRRLGEMVKGAATLPETSRAVQALVEKVELHFTQKPKGTLRKVCAFAWGTVHFRDPLSAIGPSRIEPQSDEPNGRSTCVTAS
jgi:hypothetical protein